MVPEWRLGSRLCSELVYATRSIVAGAIHASIELRVLLLSCAEETGALHHMTTLTVYVDDTGIEPAGPAAAVKRAVVGAARHFGDSIQAMGMEFSHTKNVCLASCPHLARGITAALPSLRIATAVRAKSLGGALSSGRHRNTRVLQQRLQQFRVRKDSFRKLRRAAGSARTGAVLRSGGTAALVYGQGNTGVANTMLLNQRRAVAASFVLHGAGDLDLTLTLADGSMRGRADPAFAAHDEPIGMWSEAVWCQWLPRAALEALTRAALVLCAGGAVAWAKVHGPAAAFVASAFRLGWSVADSFCLVTDRGQALDLRRDSPAFVMAEVREAVWRWRWRRLEEKHPCLAAGAGGHGPFMRPIFKLLSARPNASWSAEQQGALRSAVADRQWTQGRLFSAGLASSPNCQLCVTLGFCGPDDRDPRHRGTLLHRLWTCSLHRRRTAPDGSCLAS